MEAFCLAPASITGCRSRHLVHCWELFHESSRAPLLYYIHSCSVLYIKAYQVCMSFPRVEMHLFPQKRGQKSNTDEGSFGTCYGRRARGIHCSFTGPAVQRLSPATMTTRLRPRTQLEEEDATTLKLGPGAY